MPLELRANVQSVGNIRFRTHLLASMQSKYYANKYFLPSTVRLMNVYQLLYPSKCPEYHFQLFYR